MQQCVHGTVAASFGKCKLTAQIVDHERHRGICLQDWHWLLLVGGICTVARPVEQLNILFCLLNHLLAQVSNALQ